MICVAYYDERLSEYIPLPNTRINAVFLFSTYARDNIGRTREEHNCCVKESTTDIFAAETAFINRLFIYYVHIKRRQWRIGL